MKRIVFILCMVAFICVSFLIGKTLGEKSSLAEVLDNNKESGKSNRKSNRKGGGRSKKGGTGSLKRAVLGSKKRNKKVEPVEEKDSTVSAVPVKVMNLKPRDLTSTSRISGVIEALQRVVVRSKKSGIIDEIYVKEGDIVTSGQVLADLESENQKLSMEKAKNQVDQARNRLAKLKAPPREEEVKLREYRIGQAKIKVEQSRDLLKTNKELFSEKLLIETKLDESLSNYNYLLKSLNLSEQELIIFKLPPEKESIREMELIVEQNEIEYKNAQLDLREHQLTSPMDGVVTALYREKLEVINANQELCKICNLNAFKVVSMAPFSEASAYRKGLKCSINAEDSILAMGQIELVSPEINADSGTVKIEMIFDKNIKGLKPGMFAGVIIEVDSRKGVMSLKKESIIRRDDKEYVYIISDSVKSDNDKDEYFKIAKKEIKTGFSDTEWIEIISGLEISDRIIVLGQNLIDDESIVRVVE